VLSKARYLTCWKPHPVQYSWVPSMLGPLPVGSAEYSYIRSFSCWVQLSILHIVDSFLSSTVQYHECSDPFLWEQLIISPLLYTKKRAELFSPVQLYTMRGGPLLLRRATCTVHWYLEQYLLRIAEDKLLILMTVERMKDWTTFSQLSHYYFFETYLKNYLFVN
jgi:hypothetical protein